MGLKSDASVTWRSELVRLSKAVLGSVSEWSAEDPDAHRLTTIAADIEAALSVLAEKKGDRRQRRQNVLCASILYDLAGFIGTAGSQIKRDGFSSDIQNYFSRQGVWWHELFPERATEDSFVRSEGELQSSQLTDVALAELLDEFGYQIQGTRFELPSAAAQAMHTMVQIASQFDIGLDADTLAALDSSLRKRWSNSTLRVLSKWGLEEDTIRSVQSPVELWPVQKAAIERGLLSKTLTSFGLAAPTGTGKTALTVLLLADFFQGQPGAKAIYVSPSRALTAEIARKLAAALKPLGISVAAMGAAMTPQDFVIRNAADADLLVFTPEKADLLMRVAPELIEKTQLVIVDEAHHIEQGTRGIILEFYLWRLRFLIPSSARIVQLSAVTPNMHELVEWLTPDKNAASAVKLDWRSSRLRLGTFEFGNKKGQIHFGESDQYQIFDSGECSSVNDLMLAQLADRLSQNGIVLLLCMSPGRAEKLANTIAGFRNEDSKPEADITSERVDARVERELFPQSSLRSLYRKRVIFHHAQLPPRIRTAIERAIAERRIDIVCATTTLAEGVNFPFATVLVESLVGKTYQLSPRSLWNIAGRAGRFGVDSEGHCIVFRPSRWKNQLKQYRFEDYMSVKLDDIPPVKSALASGITELKNAVDDAEIGIESLRQIDLKGITIDGKATSKAKRIRGLVNVMRVGYAHASVSRTMSLEDNSAPEFSAGLLLAAKQVPDVVRDFAATLGRQQREVIKGVLQNDETLLRIAARVGWSLETQESLFAWVHTRDDWKLQQYGNLVAHGHIQNFDNLGYVIGPLAKMMSEFEGEKLGGFTSFIATEWLRGIPLTSIRDAGDKRMSFGRLVHTIYSKIQYLLPWALFGLNELVQYECRRRGLVVNDGIAQLSVLASEGVPDFDAFRLVVDYDIERVDATRLAARFRRSRTETDIVGWLRVQPWPTIVGIVRGIDRRRLDPDLQTIVRAMRESGSRNE